ncbi:MAG: OmpA family protein [Alistipes finegoldii]
MSNGFWDNWEMSLGGGVGTALTNGSNSGSFGKRLGFEANFSLVKWVHPVVGMRLQLQGGQFANYDADLGKLKWPYLFVHADFMLNFSNWAGGYREDRAYYAVPFAGFGYMASNFTDKSHENNGSGTHQSFAFTLGWLNKFRISPSFDFNIELKGLIAPSRVSPVAMDGSYLFGFSATAGFTYRFNKRGWQRGVAGYTVADIQAFQDAVAASMAAVEAAELENAQLAQQLAAAQAQAAAAQNAAADAAAAAAVATVVAADEAALADTSIILFDYSMSVLTPQEKTRLELIAEQIKSGSKDAVYQIVGHADQQTGTAAGNKRVAEHRAKRVYDFLVSKGVNPKQLNYEGKGTPRSLQEGSGCQPRRDYPIIPAGRNDRFARSARPDKRMRPHQAHLFV